MNIIYPIEKYKSFLDLNKGDLFILKQNVKTPAVYIKTSESYAISLRHGNGLNVPRDTPVSRVTATLHINTIEQEF